MGTPDTPLVGWLTRAVETGASDLHIVVRHRPTLRVHGELEAIEDAVLTRERAAQALLPFCPERVREIFEREHNADFALQLGSKTVSGTNGTVAFVSMVMICR